MSTVKIEINFLVLDHRREGKVTEVGISYYFSAIISRMVSPVKDCASSCEITDSRSRMTSVLEPAERSNITGSSASSLNYVPKIKPKVAFYR